MLVPHVLIRVTIGVMQHHDPKPSWQGKGLLGLHFLYCCSSLKKVRTGTQTGGTCSQEELQRPWRGAAYCLVQHDLFNLLSYKTQDQQPKKGTIYNGLGTRHQLVWCYGGIFLISVPSTQMNFSLCQVDTRCSPQPLNRKSTSVVKGLSFPSSQGLETRALLRSHKSNKIELVLTSCGHFELHNSALILQGQSICFGN
jgi:hypothetical protein